MKRAEKRKFPTVIERDASGKVLDPKKTYRIPRSNRMYDLIIAWEAQKYERQG